jgi:hypothetical protein
MGFRSTVRFGKINKILQGGMRSEGLMNWRQTRRFPAISPAFAREISSEGTDA